MAVYSFSPLRQPCLLGATELEVLLGSGNLSYLSAYLSAYSPEARQRGYRQVVDTGSRWLPKEMMPAGFLGASGGVGTTRSPT